MSFWYLSMKIMVMSAPLAVQVCPDVNGVCGVDIQGYS